MPGSGHKGVLNKSALSVFCPNQDLSFHLAAGFCLKSSMAGKQSMRAYGLCSKYALGFSSFKILDKLLNLCELAFPHLQNGD